MASPVLVTFDRTLAALVLSLTLAGGYVGGGYVAWALGFLAVIAAWRLVIAREPLWLRDSPASLGLVAAFLLMALAFALSATSPRDLSYALNFLVLALAVPLGAFLARQATPRSVQFVAAVAVAGTLIGGAVAAYQVFVEGLPRAMSFGSDPIWSAQAMVMTGFFASLGVLATRSPWRIVFLAGPAIALLVAIIAESRGAALAIPVLAFLVVVMGARRRWLALGTVLAMAVLGLGLAWVVWPSGLQRLATLFDTFGALIYGTDLGEVSANERVAMYRGGIAAFLHNPLFGYGWEQRVSAIDPYVPNGLASFVSVHHHLHNDALDFAVSAGSLGLIAYVLILVAPIAGALTSPRDSQYGLRLLAATGLTVGYAVFGLTYLTFGYEYHTTLYACLAAIILGFCRDAPPVPRTPSSAAGPASRP